MPTNEERSEAHFWRTVLPSRTAAYLAPKVMGRPYNIYPWIAYIEVEIVEMLNRPGREVLILSVPPQEGKTTYSGMWLPFWYLGHHPDHLVMFLTYSDDYSATWGVRVRNLVEQFGPSLFGIGLAKSQANINNWRTTRGFGGMLSAGIGGGITGNPGHLILIDDVIKNMEEAGSPTTKRKHLEEWDGSISARFQEKTKVVITATRWTEDDLSRRDHRPHPRRRVRRDPGPPDPHQGDRRTRRRRGPGDVPRTARGWRDFLGRRIGEHLHGQHSAEFFAEKQASVSPYVWCALYQASPSARKGSMFPLDNWGWYDPDDRCNMAAMRRVWDIAATDGGGDYTVGALVGRGIDNYFYVLDVRRFQKSTSGVKKEVMRIARADSRSIPIRMEQEHAGAGKTTIGNYAEDLAGWDFEGIRAEGEKVSRFMPYADLQQTGRVRLPRRRDGTSPDWVQPFVDEHKVQMPDGRGPRHDDQIDTVAYADQRAVHLGPVGARRPLRDQPRRLRADPRHRGGPRCHGQPGDELPAGGDSGTVTSHLRCSVGLSTDGGCSSHDSHSGIGASVSHTVKLPS